MTRMPKSVLHHRIRISKMSETEKKAHFKGKGMDLLKSMAWRHGYGPNSYEYARYHDGQTPDKNIHKINEEELTEISKKVAHDYTMKSLASYKKLEGQLGSKTGKFSDVFRKLHNRNQGVDRAQKILNKEGTVIHAGEKFLDKRMRDRALKHDKIEQGKHKEGAVFGLGPSKKLQNWFKQGRVNELASDAPSNWGGWQGGFPGGNGSSLKGMKGGKGADTGKKPPKPNQFDKKELNKDKDLIKLSGQKTQVIFAPTVKQADNNTKVKDPNLTGDKPQTTKQKGIAEMTSEKAHKLMKKAIKGKKVRRKSLAKAMNKTAVKSNRPGWFYANKRMQQEAMKITATYTRGPFGNQEKQTKDYHVPGVNMTQGGGPNQVKKHLRDHPEHQKMIKDKWQVHSMAGKNISEAPLSLSGSSSHGGEETVHEKHDLFSAVTKYFSHRRSKRAKTKFQSKVAAKHKEQGQVTRHNPTEGPWGKRPSGGGPSGPQTHSKTKPHTKAELERGDLERSRSIFNAWKKHKAEQVRVFKLAHEKGLDKDIVTPYNAREARKASLAREKAKGTMK